MKLQINRDLLLSNLNNVSKAVSTKPQMPILTGIKIEAKQKYLNLIASNSDISIQARIDQGDALTIEEEGTVVLPGKYFYDIIRKCESNEVTLTTFEQNTVKLIANQSTFTLNLLDKTIFPYISFDTNNLNMSIDVLNLKQIIRKTSFATSISEAKMVLTGVSIQLQNNKLEAVATDSFRLAKKYMFLEGEYPDFKAIIPSKALDELNKIVEDVQENVDFSFSRSRALFKYKNILFQTRLIDGNFPNTTSLIPTEFVTSVKFNKNELINAIDRASLFSTSDVSNIIKLNITPNQEVIISSVANQIGGSREKLQVLNISKYIEFETAFSSKYFLEAIKAFDSNDITINFTGEVQPFIVTSDYDVNHVQLILPVRI